MSRVTVTNPTVGGSSGTWGTTLNTDLTALATATNALGTAADHAATDFVGTSRQVIAGTGLTGGGDLSADRTLTVAYGTSSTTAAVGNDSRITGAVQTTRTISNGYGVTGGGDLSANRTLAVALTTDSSALSVDGTAATSALTTLFTTASLGIGTWLVTYGLTYIGTATAVSVDIGMAAGSATATFSGQQSATTRHVASQASSGSVTCIVTVTVAGTLVMQYYTAQAVTLKATTQTAAALPKATGYTATRIA